MRKTSRFGWAELVIGILLVILGIFTFFNPQTFLKWVVRIYGIIAIVTGISDIVFYVKTTRYTEFGPIISLVTGLLSTMAGLMLLIYPGAGSWIMVLLLPIWIITHCISRLCHLNMILDANGKFYYYFTLVMNIIGIVFGVFMIFVPTLNYFAVGLIIGITMIVAGVDMIINAVGAIKTNF